jgi:ABC-2 type transport system ATP-binding protein
VAAIEVDGLVVRYGDLVAVGGLDLRAEAGQVTALLGPNGAGKTSTIEVLEGYRPSTAGTVRVLGLHPQHDHAELVRRMGVMLQGGGVYPGIRVREVAALFCAYFDNRVRADDLLERTGLTSRAMSTYRRLSGGEQQRLSLALALAGDPDVVFLDEPTAGVDVAGRRLVRQLVRDLAGAGAAVLLTTHELDEADRVADRVVIVDHGRVVADGSPQELRGEQGDEIRFGAPAGLDVAGLSASVGAPVAELEPGEYVVTTPPTPRQVAAVTAWLADHDLALSDLRAGRQRLEDVFLRLTSEPTVAAPPPRRARRRSA